MKTKFLTILNGTPTSFNLKTAGTLLYWLDASDTDFFTLSGSEVTQVFDKSGNNFNSTDDASRRPIFDSVGLNGLPTFTFASGDRINITGITASARNYTAFAVLSPTSVGTSQFVFDSLTGRLVLAHTTSTAGGRLGYYDGSYKDIDLARKGNQIIRWDLNSTGATVYRNGFYANAGAYTQTAIGSTTSVGAAYNGAGNYFIGSISELLIYSGTVSASNCKKIEQYLANKWRLPCLSSSNYSLICLGDSLTLGNYVSGGVDVGTESYPGQLQALYSAETLVINAGVSSDQLTNMDTRAASTIDTYDYSGTIPILIVWGGTNDLVAGGQTAAQTYARLRTLIQNRTATGKYSKILISLAIPRADSATTTKMFDYNDQIRDNFATLQSDGALAYIDVETLSQFNADGDYNDTTYYNADKVHLTTAGYGVQATLVKNKLDLYL